VKPLKLAVVGVGHLGRIHARLASELRDVHLAAVVDPLPENREKVAAATGAVPLADHRDLPRDIEAAIIATPTRLHRDVALDLLQRGVHLLIEKPMATTTAEADQIIDLAGRQGAVIQVGHVERFNPAFAAARQHITDPKYIEAVRTSGFSFRSTDIGVVLDLMIHDLDAILALVAAPTVHVEALGVSVMGGSEDAVQARLRFADGCVANLTASRISYESRRAMQSWSASGFVAIDFADRTATLVRPGEQLSTGRFHPESLSSDETEHLKTHLFDELLMKETTGSLPGNPLADEQRDWVEAIRTGSTPQVPPVDARRALAVAEQIIAAVDAHAWDGEPSGRRGALAAVTQPILRGPHWHLAGQHSRHREAG